MSLSTTGISWIPCNASSSGGLNWRAFVILALSLVAVPCFADPTGAASDGADGVFGEAQSGKGEADGRTGAFSWAYPFQLPASRGRPQQQLSLTYHSSARDREAGYGWGLDIPYIERAPISGNPCFDDAGAPVLCGRPKLKPQADERYTFSGMPLVHLCTLPQEPTPPPSSCPSETHPTWALTGGWRYFRLQSEGQFSRFYLSPNRRLWRVQLKGGDLLELGEPPNATSEGVEHASDNKNAVLRWRLVRHFDALHTQSAEPVNYVEYRWERLGKRGLLFLKHIYSTTKATGHQRESDFAHHTSLYWEVPDFPQTHYADPFKATPDLRLRRIAVASKPWSGEGPREVIRSYVLTYQQVQGTSSNEAQSQVFYPWKHSFLKSIQMQGRCGKEDANGLVDRVEECRGSLLPETTFKYEDGTPTFGIASLPAVTGGPRDAVQTSNVLQYISSVGLVDIDRDGLPDVVQGWDPALRFNTKGDEARPMVAYLNRGVALFTNLEHQCFDAGALQDSSGLTFYTQNSRNSFFASSGGATLVGPWSEGVLAWSNAGYAPYRAKPVRPAYDLSLLDVADTALVPTAGANVIVVARVQGTTFIRIFDSKGVRQLDRPAEEVLPDQTLELVNQAYSALPAPAGLKSLLTGQILLATGAREPGAGCDPGSFDLNAFRPGWKWEQTQSDVDWAKLPIGKPSTGPQPTGGSGPYGSLPRWFVDVDGDGLVDRMASTGQQAFDFETAYVEFTRRYAKGGDAPIKANGPVQIPFLIEADQPAKSLVPSFGGTQAGTKYWYVDINGDGLTDLVTFNARDGWPQVRPGNGRGEFSCVDALQPWPCEEWATAPTRHYPAFFAGPVKPWPFNDETFFEDVTGDGLADLVRYDMQLGEVRVWVNQDGRTFACVTPSCIVGKVVNANAAVFGLSGSAAWDIGEHRTTFADMNGDGINDIVILARTGVYVGTFMKKDVKKFDTGYAPRPGVLIRIENGYGATTDLQYKSIQELDLETRADPELAWRTHVPVVDLVVSSVTTQDSAHANGNAAQIEQPYRFKRVARYFYQDPAYDRWARSFMGFRKSVAQTGNDPSTTSTTYWFGPCQNNRLSARLASAPESPLCPEGSDDDRWRSLTGKVLRVERGTEHLRYFSRDLDIPPDGRNQLLWARYYSYSEQKLFTGEGRTVTFAYPDRTDTYLYDENSPVFAGGYNGGFAPGGDRTANPSRQPAHRRHLRSSQELDKNGSLIRLIEYGAVVDADSPAGSVADAVVHTVFSDKELPSLKAAPASLSCDRDWRCQASHVSSWEPGNGDGAIDRLLRKRKISYTASGDIESVSVWIDGAEPLQRQHPLGPQATAQTAQGHALARGWYALSSASYDVFGNVVETAGPATAIGASRFHCTRFSQDVVYAQFTIESTSYVDGCGSGAQTTRFQFDRGSGQVTSATDPSGSITQVEYDLFARPAVIRAPDPAAPPGAPPILAETFTYSDRAPISYVESRRYGSPSAAERRITVLNGVGETIARLEQSQPNSWTLRNWVETDSTGRVKLMRGPWLAAGDPLAKLSAGTSFQVPGDNVSLEIQYDSFGRRASMTQSSAGGTRTVMRTAYGPLSVEQRDAEQVKPAGPHSGAFSRTQLDGRGRPVVLLVRAAGSNPEEIRTRITYTSTGEVERVQKQTGSSRFERTMRYDTLGRLVLNAEPNAGSNLRYAWDVAGRLVGTSDARGCGVNLYYDGLNRVVGEDYSPCLTTHRAYSAPDLANGTGLEVFNRYDQYEPAQVKREPGFEDDERFALGRLVSIADRGGRARFSYDSRGLVRRISRLPVAPTVARGSLEPRSYSSRWFTSRMDFDLADKLTRRTSGVDLPEFLVAGRSEEFYAYSPTGDIASIGTTYGTLIESVDRDAYDAARQVVLGDSRKSVLRTEFDQWRRPAVYQLIAPAKGAEPPIGFFDFRFTKYDDVGNLLEAGDQRIPWTPLPASAAPITRQTLEYDNLYRLTKATNSYRTANGASPWASPYAFENNAQDSGPVPLKDLSTRVRDQQFAYDGLGNITRNTDDQQATFDRSLAGAVAFGPADSGPNQVRNAQGVSASYDRSGNLVELKIARDGVCPTPRGSACAQWFILDWDEVGQLARARRWDFLGNSLPAQLSTSTLQPAQDLSFDYSQGMRILKSVTDSSATTRHTVDVFDTLRLEGVDFDRQRSDFVASPERVNLHLGGLGHVYWDRTGQLPAQPMAPRIVMHLLVGDYLGSNTVVLNHQTSSLVQRSTFHPYGAIESSYRPSEWKGYRSTGGFTGKETDVESGLIYFGARYYHPHLAQFVSPDPLTIHGLGADLNPYAYVGGRVKSHTDPAGLDGTTKGTSSPMPDCPQGAYCPEPVEIKGHVDRPTPPAKPAPAPAPQQKSSSDGQKAADTPKEVRAQLTFERGDPSSAAPQPTRGDLVKKALISNLQTLPLDLVDPLHVNRNFIRDVQTVTAQNSSPIARGVAGGSILLSVLPVGAEGAALMADIRAASGNSKALVQILSESRAGGNWMRQTVAILETAEGPRLVAGGRRDLGLLQRFLARFAGLTPVKLNGAHGEETLVRAALDPKLALTPEKGFVSRAVCPDCGHSFVTGEWGRIFEVVGEKGDAFVPR